MALNFIEIILLKTFLNPAINRPIKDFYERAVRRQTRQPFPVSSAFPFCFRYFNVWDLNPQVANSCHAIFVQTKYVSYARNARALKRGRRCLNRELQAMTLWEFFHMTNAEAMWALSEAIAK